MKVDLIYSGLLGLACLLLSCTNTIKQYDWKQGDGYRWSELSPGGGGGTQPGFEVRSSSETNIMFRNNLRKEDTSENRHHLNGSGVALGDVNGDGWTDIYFAQLNGPNKLYKNMGGWKFVDVTDSAGVAHAGYFSTGVVFSDVDGDRDLDLFVTSMTEENVLYINDGTGKFSRSNTSGLESGDGSLTMSLADIDGDRDLDLYVANYKEKSVLDLFDVKDLSWENTVKETHGKNNEDTYAVLPPFSEHYTILQKSNEVPDRREIGRKDELYLNTGKGRFKKATDFERRFLSAEGKPMGLEQDWGLTAKFHDINRDGLPDLYVCNDYWTKDRMWVNRGKGVFRAVDPLAIRNLSFSSMSVDFSDINRDSTWDFFITEMLSSSHQRRLRQFIPDDPHPVLIGQYDNQPQYNRNSLYVDRGDGTYAEISYFSGLEASEWSWASRFLDIDLDGYEDLLVTTGYSYDVQDLDAQNEWRNGIFQKTGRGEDIHIFPSLELPDKLYRNNGGLGFTEVSSQWGFNGDDVSNALATADLDHDGDLDLVINRLNKEAAVFENKATAPRILVRLVGKAPNTQAIGATINLKGGPVNQMDEIEAGGEYLSGSDPQVMFAAAADNPNHVITVTWPDGQQRRIDSVKANRIYEIDEESIDKKTVASDTTFGHENPVIFQDVSDRIDHQHHEESFDDFYIQPLLPMKLSRQGPGISWIDFDADNDDDLFIASGRGGKLAVYENRGNGAFNFIDLGAITRQTVSDQTTVLGWSGDKGTKLLVGNANYEAGNIKAPAAYNYTLHSGVLSEQDSLPGIFSTTGALAAADYDGDGNLDLFMGGRFIPSQYPADATSRLFKNEDGGLVLDQQNTRNLRELGLVTGAIFIDYDNDGDQDLLCSQEWGSLKLFRNENGNFQDVSESTGLSQYHGWWNGVAAGDFNNDGRPDIVATNVGLNSPYQLESTQPLQMYYEDFNRDGRMDIIESYYDTATGAYVPRFQLKAYESISASFSNGIGSNEEFSNASVKKLLGRNFKRIRVKKINTLAHTLFINDRQGFSARPLPADAQLSSAFYAGVADYNNDGNEDLFLTQNFFQVRPGTPRMDGGRGAWLKGDGRGNLATLPGQTSGVKIYGEQRGAAFSDFNGDGKVDLAVSQNGAETKLYLNKTKKTGLTIRLKGPSYNQAGIGSGIRLLYEDGTRGPRRLIQTGSGYWSQNSATQIMGYSKKTEKIEIAWFDGRTSTAEVIEGKKAYVIDYSDALDN